MEFDSEHFFYNDSMRKTLNLMREYGGSFEASLANTYCYGDIHNRHKIFATWPELFGEYGPYGIFWNRTEQEEGN